MLPSCSKQRLCCVPSFVAGTFIGRPPASTLHPFQTTKTDKPWMQFYSGTGTALWRSLLCRRQLLLGNLVQGGLGTGSLGETRTTRERTPQGLSS